MAQAKVYPQPVINNVTENDIKTLNEQISKLIDAKDIDGLAKLVEFYPISAKTLDGLKRQFGMEYLLTNKYNLKNAIDEYGLDWLNEK